MIIKYKYPLVIVLTLFVALLIYYWQNPPGVRVKIGNNEFRVKVAITPEQKQLGLGFREKLDDGQGMLFPFDHKERYSFWMKNMKIPIDIIWIEDTRVVDISRNIPNPRSPDDSLSTYQPSIPVNKVLELNAGSADRYNIKIGDLVHIRT